VLFEGLDAFGEVAAQLFGEGALGHGGS
jgi:hypothetical protein